MFKNVVGLLALAVVAPVCTWADGIFSFAQCQAGTVTSILDTTCNIGDKTFQFGGVASFDALRSQTFTFSDATGIQILSGDFFSTDFLTFTPDASQPNSPGFIISAAPNVGLLSLTANGLTGQLTFFDMSVIATLTDPSSGAVIIGSRVTTNGAEVTENGLSPDLLFASAENQLFCGADAVAGQTVHDDAVGLNSVTASSDSVCTPAAQVAGLAAIRVGAFNGSASLTSAGFYYDEAPGTAVPEPASIALFGTALAFIARKISRYHANPDFGSHR
jgi:hypothetical protein